MLKIMVYCIVTLFSSSINASNYESLSGIETKVYDYLSSAVNKNSDPNINITVGQIDKRLKLAKCNENKLRIFSPYNRLVEQSSTIAIKCSGPVAWSLFVPVNIKILKKVVVTNKHIPRGHLFVAGDLKVIQIDANKLRHGFFVNPQMILGKISKRIMIKNKIVSPSHLKLAKLISKGDLINLTAKSETIKVSVKGVALKGGRLGDYIAVKNLTSQKIIEAKVIGKKEVLIKL